MSSTSSQSEQYEGGGQGSVNSFEGGYQADGNLIQDAQEMYTLLQEERNPEQAFVYDFTDPRTGDLTSSQERLDELQSIIRRLKEHKKRQESRQEEEEFVDKPEEFKDNQQPAGDEFLVWEPRGAAQKVKSILWNMMEVIMVLCIGVVAYVYPSACALVHFWAYLIMFLPMTKNIKERYKWNMFFLFILLGFQIVFLFVKRKVHGEFEAQAVSDTKENYYKVVSKLLSMGFVFKFDENILDKTKWESVKAPYKIGEVDQLKSHYIEITAFIFNLIMLVFSKIQRSKIENLQKIKRQDFLDFIKLMNPEEDSDEEEEEQNADEINLGADSKQKEVLRKKELEWQKEREAEENEQKLKDLKQVIKLNIVGSAHFYKFNKVFFTMIIFWKLVESVTFNSLSCLPGLIFVILLFSMYDLRKKYSQFYRTFSFFVVYWIQFVMIIKLSVYIYMSIPSVNIRLLNQKDTVTTLSESSFLQMMFGELHSLQDDDFATQRWAFYQFLAFYLSIFCSQGWKTCKWLEIRDKTSHMKHANTSARRFREYIKVREEEDKAEMQLVEVIKTKERKSIKHSMTLQAKKDDAAKRKGRYDTGNVKKKAKKHNSYISQIVLFLAQIAMFILAYAYHSSYGLINLVWLILSFLLSTQNTLFLSVVVMIPFLTWEFLFIYCSRVHRIKNTTFFESYGKFFMFNMWNDAAEQFFMLTTLLLFYMMISSYVKRLDNAKVENGLVRFFKQKIQAKDLKWIWVFFSCRYVHILVLIIILERGISHLNCFNNLGYLVFFVLFTAYEGFYRKCLWLLILFTSIFILGQYFTSLIYQQWLFHGNQIQINDLYWWNFFPQVNKDENNLLKDPFNIKAGDSIYFRCAPSAIDWATIIMLRILKEINIMYTTERVNEYRLRREALHIAKKQTGKLGYYVNRVRRIFLGLFNYVVIVALVVVQVIIEANIITWLFFCLNLTNLAYMIKGSQSVKEIKKQYWISSIIKYYSLLVIALNSVVLAFNQKLDLKEHDPGYKKEYATVKAFFQLIGLKANDLEYIDVKHKDGEQYSQSEMENHALRNRMIAMIIFFLCSIYLCSNFSKRIKQAVDDKMFDEAEYKKLFEFKTDKKRDDQTSSSESDSDKDGHFQVDEEVSMYTKRASYTQDDLINFYEGVRFTVPFMTYRLIHWWGFYDVVAKYANLFVTGMYIYVAFYRQVTIAMCVNLCLLGSYFMFVTRNVGKRAEIIQKVSGVQSQCDVEMARLVTKRYKKEAFYEFLSARKKTWYYMFIMLMIVALLQYPTPILEKIKLMHLSYEQQRQLDQVVLALYYIGIYEEKTDLTVIGLLLLGLLVERVAINWLKNRFGCTYFKLQKFAELDQRREALRYDWDILAPPYDVERYRQHYFRNDFDELKLLMTTHDQLEAQQAKMMRDEYLRGLGGQLSEKASKKKSKYQKSMQGDYVPYKAGRRIVSTVKFCVQLDCHAKVLSLDDQTKKCLHNKNIDYESVPILREFKIEALRQILKEGVDRKYKISYYKGCQLFLEAVIIFLWILSLIMKSNIWSLVYLLMVFKYSCTRNKTNLMVRMCSYLSVSLSIQYAIFMFNMTAQSSPQPFPSAGEPSLANYPVDYMDGDQPAYWFPLFFHLQVFRDNLMLSYMLGVGIDQQQVQALTYDFLNLFIMTMYIFEFRNPVLSKSLKKVFWQFPSKDDTQQWDRLEKNVQKQVDWLFNPKPLVDENGNYHPSYAKLEKELTKEQKQISHAQYDFAKEYNLDNKKDLNYTLVTYVDLKYQTIWGEELLKEKKGEIKKNCMYYRLVKQGSQLVYVSFHIITIFVVLLMAAMRQSLFAVIYVFILLPKMKDGAEVLKQRDIQEGKELEELEQEIEDLQDQLKQSGVREQVINMMRVKMMLPKDFHLQSTYKMEMKQLDIILRMTTDEIENCGREIMKSRQMDFKAYDQFCTSLLDANFVDQKDMDAYIHLLVKRFRRLSGDQILELKDKLKEKVSQKYKLEKNFQKKNAKMKKTDRDKIARQQWSMIDLMQKWLLIYALFDASVQIVFQMPMFLPDHLHYIRHFGFRKVWHFNQHSDMGTVGLGELTYSDYIACSAWTDRVHNHHCPHFKLEWKAFYFQLMNCFIVATIMLQSEIFSSAGYIKYVTQQDGSMDLLIQLADVKAKTITYVWNNYKIRKILSIQRKREAILKTVDRLKEKITRWRQFTRTTMVNRRGPSLFQQTGAIPNQDEPTVPSNVNKEQQREPEAISEDSAKDKEVEPASPDKSVKFAQEEQIIEAVEEVEEDPLIQEQMKKNRNRISPEEREALLLKLGQEFVKAKMGKQRLCVKFYLFLQNNFVDKVMFKNDKKELDELRKNIAAGSVEVPTELETLMRVECSELIKNHYDNLKGSDELYKLIKINRDKSQSLLALTKFDKRIKLKELKMTWEYTRTLPMLLHFAETFFYILISQSQAIIYLSMIYSMYQNAGMISLFYPIGVFGYAMLEEKRPAQGFWTIVRVYTVFVLGFKFIMNLDIFAGALTSPEIVEISATIKFGIFEFQDISKLIFYMMPEILILCFLMLHEIKLQLIGLYNRNEEDVEPVLDGIERNVLKGDEEELKKKRIETQNMCMERYFESPEEQKTRMEQFMTNEKELLRIEIDNKTPEEIQQNEDYRQIIRGGFYSINQLKSKEVVDKLVDYEYDQKYSHDLSKAESQRHLIKDISKSITKTSTHFDLDSKGKKTNFDDLIREKVVQKTLEADSLIYVEGMRPSYQPKFLTRHQFKILIAKKENWEVFSAGDYKEDFEEKFEAQDDRVLNHPGWFEKQEYFDRIFPSLKIQKPGYDLYGTTTSILGLIAIYVFIYFPSYTFSDLAFDFAKGQTAILAGEMAITLILVIFIIIVERYANRSDTKKIEEKKLPEDDDAENKKSFFSNEDMFKRTTTQRSMTVKLKTVKTSDLDMSSNAAQDFLSSFDSANNDDDIEDSRTKITSQQKTKFIVHWFVLIFAHIYCFWFIPIKGNMQLYGQAACKEDEKRWYGCFNFKENGYIRFLYILFVLYLMASSYQISLGFPTLKKASSVMQWYNDVGFVIAQVYILLPFIVEIRCLLDWIFAKTSLDIFQFWQLFNYHWEMYVFWCGNKWYTIKPLGSPQECLDKFIFGVLIATGILFLLIGPFFLFSSASPYVSYNEVLQGKVNLNFQVNKTMYLHPETGHLVDEKSDLKDQHDYIKINATMPYNFYHIDNPYLKQFSKETWNNSDYSKKTETREFEPRQAQYCVLRKHSDRKMPLSTMAIEDLKTDILEKSEHPSHLDFSLQMDYEFIRAYPDTALSALMKQNRSLEYDYFNDCNTGKELKEWAQFTCGRIKDKSLSTEIIFTQAFNPAFVLGQNNWITHVNEKQKDPMDLLHDIKLTYFCDHTWDIKGTLNPTEYSKNEDEDAAVPAYEVRRVDPHTCKLKDPDAKLDARARKEMELKGYDSNEEYFAYQRADGNWSNIFLILFSMKVATSFIAAYTPATFYSIMVMALAAQVRVALIGPTFMGFPMEQTNPVVLMKLCECCYIMRHEENLVKEEECYRMLQEIIRQPQLYKNLNGTSLAGSMHPDLDHLNKEQRKKLAQLDKLERKGWDVASLKQKIIKGDREIDDFDY